MNTYGSTNYGQAINAANVVPGVILSALKRSPEGALVPMTGADLGEVYSDASLSYRVLLELPEGPQMMEGVRTAWPIWSALAINVKPAASGTPIIGVRTGSLFTMYLVHTPAGDTCPEGP